MLTVLSVVYIREQRYVMQKINLFVETKKSIISARSVNKTPSLTLSLII